MRTQTPTSAYPLQWPDGWERNQRQVSSRFDRQLTIARAYKALSNEIRRFGGNNLIISSNLRLKNDGTPHSDQRQPDDSGVAVYFQKDGEPWACGCDTFHKVQDNLWALVGTVDSLRRIERYGASQLIKAAFRGFTALPDPNQKQWWEILMVRPDSTYEEVRQMYRYLARTNHPDHNPGNEQAEEEFRRIQAAWEHYEDHEPHI